MKFSIYFHGFGYFIGLCRQYLYYVSANVSSDYFYEKFCNRSVDIVAYRQNAYACVPSNDLNVQFYIRSVRILEFSYSAYWYGPYTELIVISFHQNVQC